MSGYQGLEAAGPGGSLDTPGHWEQAVASLLHQSGISGLGTNLIIVAGSLGEGRGMGTGMGTLLVERNKGGQCLV